MLDEFAYHYNCRTSHRPVVLRPPRPDRPVTDLSFERIHRRPFLAGL